MEKLIIDVYKLQYISYTQHKLQYMRNETCKLDEYVKLMAYKVARV